jgi:hypothetical protein
VKEKGWTRDGEDEDNLPKVRWVSGGQESEEKIRFLILWSLYKGDIIIIKIILIILSVRVRWPTGHIKPPATDPTKPSKPREAASWTRDNRTDPTRPNQITRVGRFHVGRTGLSTPSKCIALNNSIYYNVYKI